MPGRGGVVKLDNTAGTTVARLFNFEVGQYRLKPEHESWLVANVVRRLSAGGSIWIMGLTSTTGPDSLNLALSKRRAESVLAFLRKQLAKDFPFKLEVDLGFGEIPALIAGLRDNIEDANWRAVVISVWDKQAPPPPPPPPPSLLQEECKRLVVWASKGVKIYTILNGGVDKGKIIDQVITVKPSPGFNKCATDFERQYSFLVNWPTSYPIIFEYVRDQGSDIVGEVIGHVFKGVSARDIYAEHAALMRLPPPYSANFHSLTLDELLNGYAMVNKTSPDPDVFFKKVPLFVSYKDMAGYTAIGISTESSVSYDVATDVYGQIIANMGMHANQYPRRESIFSVGVKAGIKKIARDAIKTLIFK